MVEWILKVFPAAHPLALWNVVDSTSKQVPTDVVTARVSAVPHAVPADKVTSAAEKEMRDAMARKMRFFMVDEMLS